MSIRHSLRGLIALSGVILAVGTASADEKTYPGAVCRPLSGGAYFHYQGTAMNSSSSGELNVICPLVADASQIASGQIVVYDRNPTYDVTCELRSEWVTSAGGVFYNWESRSTSGWEAGPKYLNYSAITTGDYYYATCSVPRTSANGSSHVASIQVTES